MVARMSDQLGRVLGGRYRLTASIGTGASAQVFLAEDVTLRRRVAVKVLHPALAADEAFLQRFRAEARAAAALSHPNLMAVYDWGEDDGPYLVLEHLGGGSLRALLDRGVLLTPAQALVVGLEAARALDVAHRKGFVHRDIKPANLLFGEDGRLRVADFGLARALSEAGWTEPGDGLVGTARYAAPEQGRGGRIDGKADVYALGLVLCEAVTGVVPLTSREGALQTLMARLETPVPVPDELDALQPILQRVGQPDPAARPDAAELGRALVAAAREMDRPAPLPFATADLADGGGVIVGDDPSDPELTILTRDDATGLLPPVPAAPASKRRRWPLLVVAVAVLAAAIAGGIVAAGKLRTPSAPVPDVATLSYDDAVAKVRAADRADDDVRWVIKPQNVYNDNVVKGIVISQVPVGKAELEDGGTIRLVVSDGPPPVPLPALANLTDAAARQAVLAAQLTVGKVTSRPDEVVPAGQVLGWSVGATPKPPTAPKRSPVDLVVSSGPAPRQVPAVAGQGEAEAKAAVVALQLAPAVQQEFSDTVEAGKVTRTVPVAGQAAARGSTVTIYVSKGPDLVEVPSISGARSLDAAIAVLDAAGLQPGNVYGRANGRPYLTDPAPGQRVKRGSAVDIILRR